MKEKIPGGFDSHEIHEAVFSTNEDNPKDKAGFRNFNPETIEYMIEMKEAYAKKLENLGKHINRLYKRADKANDEKEGVSLQEEADSLFEAWKNLNQILESLEKHTEIKIERESLN